MSKQKQGDPTDPAKYPVAHVVNEDDLHLAEQDARATLAKIYVHRLAATAEERANDAEVRAQAADRRVADSALMLDDHLKAMEKAKADVDAHADARVREVTEKVHAAEAELAAHRKTRGAVTEATNNQIQDATVHLETLKSQIGSLRRERDVLSSEVAKHKARISDLANVT